MPYRFKPKESLEENIRRIAVEQVDRVLALPGDDVERQVHETRKCLKRARALLRLVRDGLPRTQARELNATLREAGQMLSRQRDRDVRQGTLAALREGARPALTAALGRAQAHNRAATPPTDPAATAKSEAHATEALAVVHARLREVRETLAGLSLRGDTETIRRGLERTHRAARQALCDIAQDPHDEAFHELRKVVQAHWRQTVLLSGAWPQMMQTRATIAQDLSQALGQEHDFTMLAQWCLGQVGNGLAARDAGAIATACRQRQEELRMRCLAEAERLFNGKPRRFARDTVALWELAITRRKEAKRAARSEAKTVAPVNVRDETVARRVGAD
ncbi:MAG: CHAD domain-containing protein [Hyphomicrobiaceae bacterium]